LFYLGWSARAGIARASAPARRGDERAGGCRALHPESRDGVRPRGGGRGMTLLRAQRNVLRGGAPFDRMNADRAIEAFQGKIAQIGEGPAFSEAQLGNYIRDQNLLGLCVGTEPRRELHRRSEQIAITFNRFSSGSADPDLERMHRILAPTFGQSALNAGGA